MPRNVQIGFCESVLNFVLSVLVIDLSVFPWVCVVNYGRKNVANTVCGAEFRWQCVEYVGVVSREYIE